jgi:hypothetical protein
LESRYCRDKRKIHPDREGMMKYHLYIDGHMVHRFKTLENAFEWLESTFETLRYLRGVMIYDDMKCVFNRKRFG